MKNPANKYLFYDENENADDDIFWYGTQRDTLAGRHGGRTLQTAFPNGVQVTTILRYGNVLSYDGHVSLADNDMCHTLALNDPRFP